MICNILAVGDVVGDGGLDCLSKHLRQLKRLKGIHFTVVNGENASGMGILPRQARAIFDAGADVITLGNHTWNRLQIADFLEDDRYTLRPANYTNRVPGRGWGVFDGPRGLRIGVMNLIGRCEMDSNFENPFTCFAPIVGLRCITIGAGLELRGTGRGDQTAESVQSVMSTTVPDMI